MDLQFPSSRSSPSNTTPTLSDRRAVAVRGVGTDLRMSLHVFVAHTGAQVDADPTAFASLDALHQWVAETTAIPVADQILLTEKGRHVKLPTLLIEGEIFLFNKALFATNAPPFQAPQSPVPDAYEPEEPPDTLADEKNIKAWEALFKARRDWTLNLVQQCASMADAADRYMFERFVIERCVAIAIGNKKSFIQSLEARQAEVKTWFDDVEREQADNLLHWQSDLSRMETIPARSELRSFFNGQENGHENGHKRMDSLASFVERDVIRKAAARTRTVTEAFSKRIAELESSIATISTNYADLREGMNRSQSQIGATFHEEPGKIMNEVNQVAKRISADYDTVARYAPVPKSIVQASKTALLHTKSFLPSIAEYTAEMSDLVRRAVDLKNSAATGAIERMQAIASIEGSISALDAEISSMDMPPGDQLAFEQLSMVSGLPLAYGSLLVEAVRRNEWIEKMKRDSSSLAEEVAGYQEEEQRRRRKWLKNMAEVLNVDSLDGKALGIEINLLGEERSWPLVTRSELEEYLSILAETGEFQSVVENLAQATKDLDKPTRQQVKRVKGFKAGSIHEAGFGKGSLLLRGEDDTRVLREVNARLEEELKAQRSRVRKLEDVVHRQSHVGRLSLGTGFAPPGKQSLRPGTPDQATNAASPKLDDDFGRRVSPSPRRVSVNNQGSEEKMLQRKVVKLEAELLAERAARADLEKEVASNRDSQVDAKRQVDDAVSTKKDIMENMEAQQKEFANERRSLEEELRKAKQRVEEVEDELDRVVGSRDAERLGADTRFQSLVSDLDKVRKDSAAEVQKVVNRVNGLEEEIQQRDQADAERSASLAEIWNHLSPDQGAPKTSLLLSELENLSRRSMGQLKDLESAIAMAKSQNASLESELEEQRASGSALMAQVASLEDGARRVREELTAEKAKASSLAAELQEERTEIKALQGKFTEGETGTEALRMSIVEGENRRIRLAAKLADAQSHATGLDVELSIAQKKLEKLQKSSDDYSERLQQRSIRAKDLTQRLYTQTDRLRRLLETLRFAVTHQDDTMIIQRASKANASTAFNDGGSLVRSVSTPAPTILDSLSDDLNLSMLQWMDKDDEDEEGKKYAEYTTALDKFDVNVFSEAIAKRMQDVEHTARKWQKELRSYREKTHKYQNEAHDKIALRGFKPGDLALFLPTRNQVTRPWAAFNVGAPHYFLREQDGHKLHNKEWLVARISKVEERVVDLNKTTDGTRPGSDGRSIGETSEGGVSFEDDNPFDLSDGLRWYLLDAAEEKVGAPGTPGLGKAAVASARVDARGSIRIEQSKSGNDASKKLSRSLDSRRSSTNSRKGLPAPAKTTPDNASAEAGAVPSLLRRASNASSLRPLPNDVASAATAMEDNLENQHNGTDQGGLGPESPLKATSTPAKGWLKSNATSTAASPAKSRSPSVSPAKRDEAKDGRRWNSLWKFDVNMESGGKRKA